MSPDHQSCALALHLGAFIREKKYGGKMRTVLTFVPPTSPAPFTYGLKLIEPYDSKIAEDLGIMDSFETMKIDAIASDVPNYPESLDALHKIMMGFDVNLRSLINNNLMQSLKPEVGYALDRTINATAPQRLEAILRTINLYDK